MGQLRIGIVVAEREDGISELEKYITSDQADVLFFPESYLPSKHLSEIQKLAKTHRKWVVGGFDDRRDAGKPINGGIVIDDSGTVIGEHFKTSITKWEVDHGYSRGGSIKVINTELGTFGFAICYELYFPEVARTLALQDVDIIFNPIGTGMWSEQQYTVWNSFARTRAYESSAYVIGCSHYDDAIPVAFAYDPQGTCLIASREISRLIPVTIDLNKAQTKKDLDQRRPELYQELVNGG